MVVKELFDVVDTDSRAIVLYDADVNILWQKKANFPVVRCPYLDSEIAWIYRIGDEISARIC